VNHKIAQYRGDGREKIGNPIELGSINTRVLGISNSKRRGGRLPLVPQEFPQAELVPSTTQRK